MPLLLPLLGGAFAAAAETEAVAAAEGAGIVIEAAEGRRVPEGDNTLVLEPPVWPPATPPPPFAPPAAALLLLLKVVVAAVVAAAVVEGRRVPEGDRVLVLEPPVPGVLARLVLLPPVLMRSTCNRCWNISCRAVL